MKKVWLSWQHSQRSQGLSETLEFPLLEYIQDDNLVKRHLLSSIWTVYVLYKHRPRVVCLQYSFMLLVIASLYKRLSSRRIKVVCDCHTKALRRSVGGLPGHLFWYLKRRSFNNTDISIISNIGLVPDIEELTDCFMVLPDKIPELNPRWIDNSTKPYCVFVSSFATDEPVEEMISAGKMLADIMPVYITGKIPLSMDRYKKEVVNNVTFTDYISDDEYFSLLGKSAVIVALTLEEDCLQCAGYEGLSLDVPLVMSSTRALREYFSKAAVYTENKAESICEAVKEAYKNSELLKAEEAKIKNSKNDEFVLEINKLISFIDSK